MSSISRILSFLANDPSLEMRTKKTLINCFNELSFAVSLPIAPEDGGTGADLSATGGTSQVLVQETVGGDVAVRQLDGGDLADADFGANNIVTTGSITAGTTVTATGKILTTAGLGVGNSAAATAVGVLSKKMEVFNAAGVSIGFVPIYTTIT